ncbi:MAG TPA: hypothetical protein VFG78_13710, partial [Gemmatimonadota bacterium]|nr:hypothetical protein [Gemmatimonadota bacterium]
PGFFSHLTRVPSAIDSPIWGMMTSTDMISSEDSAAYLDGAKSLAGGGRFGERIGAGVRRT